MANWISTAWDELNSFIPINETISSVGEFLKTDAGATVAGAVGGAAKAGIDYMNADEQREEDRRQAREERDWRESRSKASSGNSNYGSHTSSLTKGLLSS